MFRQLENRDIEALSAITGQDYVRVRDEIHPDYTHELSLIHIFTRQPK